MSDEAGRPDPLALLARVAGDHWRAWTGLAASTAEVAALPVKTVQILVGQDPDGLLAPAPDPAAPYVARLAAADARIEAVKQEYAALEAELETRVARALEDQKLALFTVLEGMLTQLPVARHAVAMGRDVAAEDLVKLLNPLDEALATLGFAPIGEVGEEVAFDATRHQPAGGSPPDQGAPVTVKNVGYTLDMRLLRRARVSARRVTGQL